MTRDRSSFYRALALILGCICFQLLSSTRTEWIPNISPMLAVALVGAMYLPRAWGWLVGPVAMLVSELAFLPANLRTEGYLVSWGTAASLIFYALVGLLGVWLAGHKSLAKIAGASILCSLAFYVMGNTFAWWSNSLTTITPSYTPNFAGWFQANTVGLPGWQPTWTFLRNGVLGDLFFAAVLLAIFDRELLLHPLRSRVSSSSAA